MVCIGKGKHWLLKREGTHRKEGRIFRADTAIADYARAAASAKITIEKGS
ncbi:MAG: hypothetical protein WCY79_07360 [Bacteroidales bacterium]|jgi:hypothetical protein